MSEIAHTFRGIERPNIRPDGSLQSVDCALRSFAQGYLEGVENQLYGVQVRRILRQVAQTCASSADRLLHTQRPCGRRRYRPPRCPYAGASGPDIALCKPGMLRHSSLL